ncbi:MAG: hypothetical protein RIA69_07365 [Cyclobacteriaceae bacterium]
MNFQKYLTLYTAAAFFQSDIKDQDLVWSFQSSLCQSILGSWSIILIDYMALSKRISMASIVCKYSESGKFRYI